MVHFQRQSLWLRSIDGQGAGMLDWPNIVEQYGALVWKTVRRLLGHDADAEDCFQRTFLSALEVTRAEPVRHWPALLRRLATARALECLRQRIRDRRRRPDPNEQCEVGELPDAGAAESFQSAAARELAEHLRSALTQIDPLQAEVFCLACLNDCSYREIAAQLGVTVNHVGVLLNRAKGALREQLKVHADNFVHTKPGSKP